MCGIVGALVREGSVAEGLIAGLRMLEYRGYDSAGIALIDGAEITIEEIAKTIVRLLGSSSKIVYRPLPVDDPKQRRPDITRARTLLGWEPKVGLEEGLRTSIDYFKTKI